MQKITTRFPDQVLRSTSIRPHKGLTLHVLNERLHQYRYIVGAKMLYIMVGINDFTVLDRRSHTVRLVTPFLSGLILHLKNEISSFEITMKRLYPATPYIICPLYGLDVGTYNRQEDMYRYQHVIDQAVVRINIHIGRVNARNHQTTPFLCNVIHRYRPKAGIYIHMYEKLVDGLHPTNSTQRKIATYLQRSFNRLREVH